MQTSARSLVYLASTFLLGLLVGAAAFALFRPPPPGGPRGGPSGFVSHMESTIQPRDEAQRRAIKPVLDATDQRNRAVVDSSQRAMLANLIDMQSTLDSLLDPAQRDRLGKLVRQLREQPPAPPGAGRPPRPPR